MTIVTAGPGVYGPDDIEGLLWFYDMHGYVVLRGMLAEADTAAIEAECVDAQQKVVSGELDDRYGSTVFLDEVAKADKFANYVEYISELSPAVDAAITHPVLIDIMKQLVGESCWIRAHEQNGVVYQDARPGKESGYTRIGWHSDWQASPSLDVWPSTAFTVHIDGTSPANGFLRVVPGSHLWATPAPYRNANGVSVPSTARPSGGRTDRTPPFEMPLGFEKIRGEVGVYAERGDIILHDAYLWHSAARATDDAALRRHVRGGYFGGVKPAAGVEEFIKNAAR
ncbi:phytanoyl-CoA dioxygenase family protein [Williamsia muralis]|uniref:Ectoine hydroxylase-related dioxygenase (Phytanoyl-CoA dioxygenase family) n=1 Tax=Williamsia marianensis TaxID=85044 RepID=A0A315S967_WILMA|nr:MULTISPECIES: phytanoyl-CoA dioxygenase family protein [Williamsia]PVY28354.1 ectoine hydroxylase-related dioxygenase (phytanoyl-CoA dioxygenase family) [Williamsia marianensis]RKR96897.1 ectoine hydroxylase-related dioxygenase (phytanoyl-CoA dioxygenase family) [Williamsia muralis]